MYLICMKGYYNMDLTSPRTIRNIQEQFGFTFKKGLGQNFLTARNILEEIVDAAEIESGVIEVGPGFGVLTSELAQNSDKVVTIEIDERLIDVLDYTLAEYDNVKIINEDILKLDLKKVIDDEFNGEKVSIAANLPYYITTPIITKLLEEKLPIKNIVVMVQKEVAERMSAKPSTKDYGAITVLCQYYTEPSIVANVPASLFVPPPKVDSAVLKLKVLDKPSVEVKDEGVFFRVVKAAFSQRRKTLLNCLSANFPIPKDEISTLLESIGIAPSRRGETLSLEEFANIADTLLQKDKIGGFSMEIFSFGERLMIYRKRAGLSKKELAKRVGISVSTLTKYENDESQPNVDMLTDLAIALDISVMKLLSGFGDPIREKYRQGLLNISLEKMNALQERHLL